MGDGTCQRCHGAGTLHRQDCGAHGLTLPCPTCAMDALIAGDADLYEMQRRGEYEPPMRTASARIKGDKDREVVCGPNGELFEPKPEEDRGFFAWLRKWLA